MIKHIGIKREGFLHKWINFTYNNDGLVEVYADLDSNWFNYKPIEITLTDEEREKLVEFLQKKVIKR